MKDPSQKAIDIYQLEKPTTDFTVNLLREESQLQFLKLSGQQALIEEEIVAICKSKLFGFSLEASCTKELSMDEYLKVRKQIGRWKMFTCKNLTVDGDAVDKLIEYMLNKPVS